MLLVLEKAVAWSDQSGIVWKRGVYIAPLSFEAADVDSISGGWTLSSLDWLRTECCNGVQVGVETRS